MLNVLHKGNWQNMIIMNDKWHCSWVLVFFNSTNSFSENVSPAHHVRHFRTLSLTLSTASKGRPPSRGCNEEGEAASAVGSPWVPESQGSWVYLHSATYWLMTWNSHGIPWTPSSSKRIENSHNTVPTFLSQESVIL